jgi:hypothetical protein
VRWETRWKIWRARLSARPLSVNQARADWANRIETWEQLRDPANDGLGQGCMSWIYTCNYDCNTHPFILP